jgi:hypothetical protein
MHKPDVVIFSGDKPKTLEPLSKKMQSKAFMVRLFLLSRHCHLDTPKSSNISKLRDATQEQRENSTADPITDEDDEL